MRVVVTGASGNVGIRVLEHLLRRPEVDAVVGVARRPPGEVDDPRVTWTACELGTDDTPAGLREVVRGADAVVHLAWLIQPSHDLAALRRTNVLGTRQVVDAVLAEGVPAFVHASSVGVYSPGPKDRRVDESWPTDGVASSSYSRHKVEVERLLDEVEADHPALRVVRMRPGLIFQAAAASEIARYFLGPLVPRSAVQRRFVVALPRHERLVFQAVHAHDVGAAYAAAVVRDVRGAFNLAADPVLDAERLAAVLHARLVPVPSPAMRALAEVTWRLRLQPTDRGWVDMGLAVPLVDTSRARRELGWKPRRSAVDALTELLDGMHRGSGGGTPVLSGAPQAAERLTRALRTLVTGSVGARQHR